MAYVGAPGGVKADGREHIGNALTTPLGTTVRANTSAVPGGGGRNQDGDQVARAYGNIVTIQIWIYITFYSKFTRLNNFLKTMKGKFFPIIFCARSCDTRARYCSILSPN